MTPGWDRPRVAAGPAERARAARPRHRLGAGGSRGARREGHEGPRLIARLGELRCGRTASAGHPRRRDGARHQGAHRVRGGGGAPPHRRSPRARKARPDQVADVLEGPPRAVLRRPAPRRTRCSTRRSATSRRCSTPAQGTSSGETRVRSTPGRFLVRERAAPRRFSTPRGGGVRRGKPPVDGRGGPRVRAHLGDPRRLLARAGGSRDGRDSPPPGRPHLLLHPQRPPHAGGPRRPVVAAEGYILAVRIHADKSPPTTRSRTPGRMLPSPRGRRARGNAGRAPGPPGLRRRMPESIVVGDTIEVLNLGGILGVMHVQPPGAGPLRSGPRCWGRSWRSPSWGIASAAPRTSATAPCRPRSG